jgi:hypothetical protein
MPRDLEKVLKINLSELWSTETFDNTMNEMKIEDILQTPFMMEIVVQVLPEMIKKEEEESKLMQKLKKEFTQKQFDDIWLKL